MFEDLLSNGLTINALRSFLLVAEKGGYSAAAEGELSKAANLKNRISGLADPFHGVPLFQPQGRGVVLTAKGKELQSVATQALQLLEDFRRSCVEERQLIRIGGGQSLFDGIFLPQWPHIHQRLSKSRFQFHNLRTAEAVRQLKEQRIDFALVRPDALGVAQLGSRSLGKIEFALCVPHQLLKRQSDAPTLADVPRKLPMVTLAGDGQFKSQLEVYAKANKFKFQYLMECSSQAQVCSFLETGTVAAVLPTALVDSMREVAMFAMTNADGFRREAALVWLPERLHVMPELEIARREIVKLL
jgi:DNA-binding transcriptional LysR family regulator